MRVLTFFFTVFLLSPAFAGVVNLNTLYFSDGLTTATDQKTSRMQWDLAIGIHIGNKKFMVAQLVYGSFSATDTDDTVTKTYAQTDMGFNFGFYIGRSRNWIIDVAYMLTSKAKFSDGSGSDVEWRGTSIKADIGYLFEMDENFQFSAKLFYYMPAFIEQISNTTTIEQVSYRRATMYPGFAAYWVF